MVLGIYGLAFHELSDVGPRGAFSLVAFNKLRDQDHDLLTDDISKIKNCRFHFIKGDCVVDLFSL